MCIRDRFINTPKFFSVQHRSTIFCLQCCLLVLPYLSLSDSVFPSVTASLSPPCHYLQLCLLMQPTCVCNSISTYDHVMWLHCQRHRTQYCCWVWRFLSVFIIWCHPLYLILPTYCFQLQFSSLIFDDPRLYSSIVYSSNTHCKASLSVYSRLNAVAMLI